MKLKKIYMEFEKLATKMDFKIIHGVGDFNGGFCNIKGDKLIVLNKKKPIEQRLNILRSIFEKFNLENKFLVPALRKYIETNEK